MSARPLERKKMSEKKIHRASVCMFCASQAVFISLGFKTIRNMIIALKIKNK